MIRVVLLVLCIGFTPNLYAKLPSSVIGKASSEYLTKNRVLFYIGKHKQSDKVVIWGQTAVTEDMVQVLLESPHDVGKMEELLRRSGNHWAENYDSYSLYNFMLIEPNQSDRVFAKVIRASSELAFLNSYVDRIEEVDGIVKLLDKDGNAVLPVEKGEAAQCAMAEGDVCHFLYRSFRNYSEGLVQLITPKEEELLAYFEKNMQLMEENGIAITDIVKELGFKNGHALGHAIKVIKEKLSEDPDHFIHRIETKRWWIDGKLAYFYGFADAIAPITPKEKELLVYFEKNLSLLDGNGIAIASIAKELGFSYGTSLGHALRRLKKKLSEDPDHFIHRIEPEKQWVDGKQIFFYRFTDTIAPITPKEEKVILYFEKNIELLEQGVIVIANMADKLGFTHSTSLGHALRRLKEKLSEDPDHFIHRIEPEKRWVDDKEVTFYHFADAIVSVTPKEKDIIAYLEKNMKLLEQVGILIADMAKELGFKHGISLGYAITRIKKKLSGEPDHFIHRIRSERQQIDSQQYRFYRFVDATTSVTTITPKEKDIIAYLEKNMKLLEGEGIVIADMAKKLGFSHGISLGHALRRLKKKLSGEPDHFIHKIVPKTRRAITFYHIAP